MSCQSRTKVSVHYLLQNYCIGFIFYTQIYNYKIQVKFNMGQNPLIILGVMALFQLNFCLKMISLHYLLKVLLYWIHILYKGILSQNIG